ncbi:MAG: methylated-DNA--[protein]-cysteine S-methyltransferase [Planctomycetota bacterium]
MVEDHGVQRAGAAIRRAAPSVEPQALELETFHTALGWMALLSRQEVVCQLVFGYPTSEAALTTLDRDLLVRAAARRGRTSGLARQLADFAEGAPIDFSSVAVDCGRSSAFHARVREICRQIPYGATRTYAAVAAAAGSPGAARAVGNCMARNRVPILVPCHRVVGSGGALGGFSAPGGISLKQRLLSMEAGTGSFRLSASATPR